MYNKVCILAAGKGIRLQSLPNFIHKALIPINNKPVISHIIDKFPNETEFVIALNYKADLIIEFLNFAYPDRKFIFVNVDTIEVNTIKSGGPGYSLFSCKDFLQEPFLLTTCDTIVETYDSKLNDNWIGYSNCSWSDIDKYCTLDINPNSVINTWYEKTTYGTSLSYIGIAYIKDYDLYFEDLEEVINENPNREVVISDGWKTLVLRNLLHSKCFNTWYDTGNIEELKKTQEALGNNITLDKKDEFLYFLNGSVIKYFSNENTVKDRVLRANSFSPGILPKITKFSNHFYAYDYINGNVYTECVNTSNFKEFLNWSYRSFWQSNYVNINFKDLHEIKTYRRIKEWFNLGLYENKDDIINGIKVPTLNDLLLKIDWKRINNGILANIHGDLHFENVIYDGKNFTGIDWRHNFGTEQYHGDVYYDLAKIYHGIIVNHDSVRNNQFTINVKDNNVTVNILQSLEIFDCLEVFKEFCMKWNYDWYKVKILGNLIFLNVCSLHHYPYNLFLYYLGKFRLYKVLNNEF